MGSISKFYPGTLFLVVGNSGSGKDSIISGVVKRYLHEMKKIGVKEVILIITNVDAEGKMLYKLVRSAY